MRFPEEHCRRCGAVAPPPTLGPAGQAEQGWLVYEGEETLIVDVPFPATVLPVEVARAIGEHDGLVEIHSIPRARVAAISDVVSEYGGLVCAKCQEETGWDHFEWMRFLALRDTHTEPEEEPAAR